MYKYKSFPAYRNTEVNVRMSNKGISIRFSVKGEKTIVGPGWSISLMKPFTKDTVEVAAQKMISWAVKDKVHAYMPDEIITDIYDWIKAQKELIS